MRGIELPATRPIRLHSSVKKRQCSVRQCVSERSPSPSLAANSAPTQSKGTICTSVTRRTSAGRPCQSSTISMSPASGIDSPSKSHDQARLQVPRFTPARMSAISDSESASESPNPPTRTYPLGRCMSCSAKSVTSSSTLLPIYFGILSIASIGIGISRGDCRRLMGCCRMSQNARSLTAVSAIDALSTLTAALAGQFPATAADRPQRASLRLCRFALHVVCGL